MHEPRWTAVKRAFGYLESAKDLCLTIDGNSDLKLTGSSDADWSSNTSDRKSMSGSIFFLGTMPLSWKTKVQSTVATSSTDAEYVSLGMCNRECVYSARFLLALDSRIDRPKLSVTTNQLSR